MWRPRTKRSWFVGDAGSGDQPFTWHVATPTGVSTSSVNSSESDDGGLYGP